MNLNETLVKLIRCWLRCQHDDWNIARSLGISGASTSHRDVWGKLWTRTLLPSHKLCFDFCRAKSILLDFEESGHVTADIADPGFQKLSSHASLTSLSQHTLRVSLSPQSRGRSSDCHGRYLSSCLLLLALDTVTIPSLTARSHGFPGCCWFQALRMGIFLGT